MQFLKRILKTYFESDSIPFAITLLLFVLTITSMIVSIGCHPYSAQVSKLIGSLVGRLFIFSLISLLGILIAAIYQLSTDKTKKGVKNLILFTFSIVLGIFGLVVFFATSCDNSPSNRASAIEVTREWSRLAPLPQSANNIEIEVTGGMFTRGFIITFEAPKKDIETWLKMSPGTKNTVPIKQSNGLLVYEIKPGEGAQFAVLTVANVSKDVQKVRIRTYWS